MVPQYNEDLVDLRTVSRLLDIQNELNAVPLRGGYRHLARSHKCHGAVDSRRVQYGLCMYHMRCTGL